MENDFWIFFMSTLLLSSGCKLFICMHWRSNVVYRARVMAKISIVRLLVMYMCASFRIMNIHDEGIYNKSLFLIEFSFYITAISREDAACVIQGNIVTRHTVR